MKKLAYYEKRERALGQQFFDTFSEKFFAYNFTNKNSFKGYDGTFLVNEIDPSTFFEIKVRDFPLNTYPDYILEAKKANTLSKITNKGFPVKYMNFFKNENGTYDLIVFDLTYRIQLWREQGIERVIQKKWMNAETFRSRNAKCEKEVIMIAFDQEIDTKFQGFGWYLN